MSGKSRESGCKKEVAKEVKVIGQYENRELTIVSKTLIKTQVFPGGWV